MLNRLPIFTITLTAIFFVGFVQAVTSRLSSRVIENVHEWPVPRDEEPVYIEPDMSDVEVALELWVIVRGSQARQQWRWEQSEGLVLRMNEYGTEHTGDTSWCRSKRIAHASLRDADACRVYLTFTPEVSERLTVTGKLAGLPNGYEVSVVGLPRGFVRDSQNAFGRAWGFGIAYLVGCWLTVRGVRKRRKKTTP